MVMAQSIKTLRFVVQGEPVGQGRPRFSSRGGFVKAYDPAKSRDEKAAVRMIAQNAIQAQQWNMPSEDMPIELKLDVYRTPPKGKQIWLQEAGEMGLVAPLSKPDIDNVCKLYMDAMSGVVYPDDKQIYKATIERHYSSTPRVEVEIKGLFINLGEIKEKANLSLKAKKEME